METQEIISKTDEYIKEFEDKLGFFKSLLLLPVKGKIRKVIVEKTEIGNEFDDIEDLGRWKNVIKFVSPDVALQLYDFMKKTILELQELKDEVLTGKKKSESPGKDAGETDQGAGEDDGNQAENKNVTNMPGKEKEKADDKSGPSSLTKTIRVGVGGIAAKNLTENGLNRIIQAKEAKKYLGEINVENTRALMDNIVLDLENQMTNNKNLTPRMKKNLGGSVESYKEAIKHLDGETMSALKSRGQLDKLSNSTLKEIGVSSEISKILVGLDEATLKEIALLKDGEAIKTLLKNKGIKGSIPEELIRWFAAADTGYEVKLLIDVASHAKGLQLVKNAIKSIGVLDMVFLALPVYEWSEEYSDAEVLAKTNEFRASNKKWKAGYTLASNVLAFIGMIMANGCIGGPFGFAAALAIGMTAYAVDQTVYKYYFDVVDFFRQDREAYISQQRTEIKEAILQSNHTLVYGNTTLQLKTVNLFGSVETDQKIKTLKDARDALIYLEEIDKDIKKTGGKGYPLLNRYKMSGKTKPEFRKGLTEEEKIEYDKEDAVMQKIITARMGYITNVYRDEKIFTGLQTSQGLHYIAKVMAESDAYVTMTNAGKWTEGIGFDANKKIYKKELLSSLGKDQKKIRVLETLYTKNPNKFRELYAGAECYKLQVESVKPEETDYADSQTMLQNIKIIEEYYKYISFGEPQESSIEIGTFDRDKIDYTYLASRLLGLDDNTTVTYVFAETEMKAHILGGFYRKGLKEENVSVFEKTGNNVLYRIAKENYGYAGVPDMKELMAYFSKDKAEVNGLYYDEKWYIYGGDKITFPIDFDALNNLQEINNANIDKKVDETIDNRFWETVTTTMDPISGTSSTEHTRKSFIETKTGNVDKDIMDEVVIQFRRILKEELSYRTPENKKIIEQEIVAYVQKNAQGGYVQLPYYMLIQATKSGIGNLSPYLFAYDKSKGISACTLKSCVGGELNFKETKTKIIKEYVRATTEEFPESTKKYVDYVDAAKTQFVNLISFDGGDLNISAEYLKTYRDEVDKWERFKKSLVSLDPEVAGLKLEGEYRKYHDYFENLYIAMLFKLSGFSSSALGNNDLDDIVYLKQIDRYANQVNSIAVNNGKMSPLIAPDYNLDECQRNLFYTTIKTQKIDGKTVSELAESDDEKDKQKAIRGVKQILKSIFEAQMLDRDAHGNIRRIYHGNVKYIERLDTDDKTDAEILAGKQNRVNKRLAINMAPTSYFDTSVRVVQPENIDYDKVTITALSAEKEHVMRDVVEVQKEIERMDTDKIWLGRGEIIFNPETGVLTSRSKDISVDAGKLAVKGLNMSFASVRELLYAANFINWMRGYYLIQNPTYKGKFEFSEEGKLYADVGFDTVFHYNPTTLSAETITAKYPSLKIEANQKIFKTYLNALSG